MFLFFALMVTLAFQTPLLLTPFIEQGKIEEARNLSKVTFPNGMNGGYSGYMTVPSQNKELLNNIFFWLQVCETCSPDDPFLIWLQGGPGAEGTFGAFGEIGQFWVGRDITLNKRGFSWCNVYNCLFVDQPVMTGLSFQTDKQGKPLPEDKLDLTNNSREAMTQVLEVLLQVFKVWDEFKDAPFYITGESYAGMYVPHLGAVIEDYNEANLDDKVNLMGLAVGDPLISSKYQFPTYGSSMYAMGVLMLDEKEEIDYIMDQAIKTLDDCKTSYKWVDSVFNDDGALETYKYLEMTGSSFPLNVLLGSTPEEMDYLEDYMKINAVQKALHYEGTPSLNKTKDLQVRIYDVFVDSGDLCSSSVPIYADLFVNYGLDMMIYSSTIDPILGPPTTEAAIIEIFKYAAENFGTQGKNAQKKYNAAKKQIWKVKKIDDNISGYAKCFDLDDNEFCYTVVRNAGHMTPSFQPRVAYDMLNRFILGKGFGDWEDPNLPNVPQCGGCAPFAGYSLPECN